MQSYASETALRQVPSSLVLTATSAGASGGSGFAARPADAVDLASEDEQEPASSVAGDVPVQPTKLLFSAAVLEGNAENLTVIQEWDGRLYHASCNYMWMGRGWPQDVPRMTPG